MLDAWFAKYGLNKLPKYIFGISSGAAFAIKFPRTYLGLAGVVSGKPRGWALGGAVLGGGCPSPVLRNVALPAGPCH